LRGIGAAWLAAFLSVHIVMPAHAGIQHGGEASRGAVALRAARRVPAARWMPPGVATTRRKYFGDYLA
jgi:hypothetical protein